MAPLGARTFHVPRRIDIYRGKDPRELPVYPLSAAAHYLRIPSITLRRWVVGQEYTAGGIRKLAAPVIEAADPERERLSFVNNRGLHTAQPAKG